MEQIIEPTGQTSAAPGDIIKEASTATFAQDVIEASQEVPVIVDFWAPWCGPCKQLGPILEKVVTEANGAVKLVKVDIDQNQQIAQQLRIQSIPAVFAFHQGRPVDGFQGAVPESQIKEFVKRLTDTAGTAPQSPIDEALAQAKALVEASEFSQASTLFEQIVEHDPENIEAKVGLANCSMETGDDEKARAIIESLKDEDRNNPDIAKVISALALAEKAAQSGDHHDLQAAVDANPSDHQARYDLAIALYGGNERETAIDELLIIVQKNRGWNDDAARKQLVEFFDAMGSTDPLTIAGRRKLSSLLFS